ncbi:hypothetical protein SLS62_008175 [Diatrype stigma]|uniref:Uncharacterized protein n=1 Tax=Diatrype stigma TaxID=117547 RepID=A0AAN9UTK0_9PEZI
MDAVSQAASHHRCVAVPMLGDPLRGMYTEVATGLARIDHFVVLLCAAVVLYAFLMVELFKEVLRKGREGEGWEEDAGDDGIVMATTTTTTDSYDEKDDITLLKQALGLGLQRGRGQRKRLLDSMV